MTLLERMDHVAKVVWVDRIAMLQARPHALRWTPLALIAAMIGGYMLMTTSRGLLDLDRLMTGYALFYGAFLGACFARVFGPRLTPTLLHPLDERELMVKAQAGALSGTALATLAMLGCFYMAATDLPGLWQPQTPADWVNLGFGFQAATMLLPTLIASWLQPRPTEDED